MAGKFGPICIEFPLATFLAKNWTELFLRLFPPKKLCSISYRNSVEYSIFLVKFCHSISLSLQVSGTRYCTHTGYKLRNTTWQVLKWKFLAKDSFFEAKNLSILFPFLENFFQLTNALNNFTCSRSFILSRVIKTCITCHVNVIKSRVYATKTSNSEETSLVTKSAGLNFFPKTLSLVGFRNNIMKIKAICKLCLWIFANIFHQHNLHNCRTWSKCVNFSQLKKGLHAGLNPNIISRRAIRWSFPLL